MSDTEKSFVLDTNVLIHKPDAFLSFKGNEVVIPIWVLEELDHLKSHSDEKGRNVREAIRNLDSYSNKGDFSVGIKIANNITLRILTKRMSLPNTIEHNLVDNKLLGAALYLQEEENKKVFFVSKDINARVKANALGIKAVDYEKQKVDNSLLYPGFIEISLSQEEFDFFANGDSITIENEMFCNQHIIAKAPNGHTWVGRYDGESQQVVPMSEDFPISISGIKPLNDIQKIAFNLLLNEDIPLVSLVGKAGTGKTLLALAAGLRLVSENSRYNKMLVSRPVIPMGKDIGFLPGDKKEKMSHWMQPLFDNLDFIITRLKKPEYKNAESFVSKNLIEVEALTYIRGRSLPDQIIIIDEAQNLTPHEIKTIVSRAGEGTKIILTGDPYQIDNPYLDENSNGLSYLVEAFKGQKLFGHVTLAKSERSKLAELAADLL
ncbi:MAG: PhoH family protein [Spirochaetales bacterium]|nr:PhoH family protein [Spirochaetales bacterium]